MLKRILLLLVFLCPGALGAQINWETDFETALERAKTENRPLFIAINMDGEAVCEELVEQHYRDRKIVKLSQHLVSVFASKYSHAGSENKCPRAGNIPCALHQQVEKDLRKHLGKEKPIEDMIAPSHIFLNPNGEVIFSVPYMITPGQLEWCMKEAVKNVDASFSWSLSSGARAPRRLRYNEVALPGSGSAEGRKAEPLTQKELEEVITLLKKSGGRRSRSEESRNYFPSLIVTESPEAMKYVKTLLTVGRGRRGGQDGRLAKQLHEIGRTSPPVYWEVVAPFISHATLSIRNEAIVALEQLAAPESLKGLIKQLAAEEEVSAKANLLRAVASVGRGNRSAESKVLKAAEREKSEFLRINALIGLQYLDNREAVNEILVEALTGESIGSRVAAAYTIATRRETDLADALRIAAEIEEDPKASGYLQEAVKVIEGGNLEGINDIPVHYAADAISRDR